MEGFPDHLSQLPDAAQKEVFSYLDDYDLYPLYDIFPEGGGFSNKPRPIIKGEIIKRHREYDKKLRKYNKHKMELKYENEINNLNFRRDKINTALEFVDLMLNVKFRHLGYILDIIDDELGGYREYFF